MPPWNAVDCLDVEPLAVGEGSTVRWETFVRIVARSLDAELLCLRDSERIALEEF